MLNIIVHFSRIEKSVDAENFCQGIRVEIKTKIKKKKKILQCLVENGSKNKHTAVLFGL